MPIQSEQDMIEFIRKDKWMMELLECTKSLDLPDWWICAGFIRSKVWDVRHGFENRTRLPDVDVIYYDSTNLEVKMEKSYEEMLNQLLPTVPWSVKNQARMHLVNQIPPYASSEDAIAKFPETATSLGVKLDEEGIIRLTAPHGVADVVNLTVKPTPYFLESKDRMKIYEERIKNKNWQKTWSRLEL